MKSFYAFLDTGFVKYAPQPLQHLAVANKASKAGGGVTYYTMEDFDTLTSQGVMKTKIDERPAIDGVVCFTVRQFFYSGSLNLSLMRSILESGYEIHFAREDISILDNEALDSCYPMLYSTQYLLDRDEKRENWSPVWDAISKSDYDSESGELTLRPGSGK